MLEALVELGSVLDSEDGFLQNLLEPLNVRAKNVAKKIIFFNFDTDQKVMNFDLEEADEDSSRKYLWVGNAKGNKPQLFAATTQLAYLLSQTVPNMLRSFRAKAIFLTL